MIISRAYGFVYFKAYKVAGTSTLYALARGCDPARDWYGQPRNLEGLPPVPGARDVRNHAFPSEVRETIDRMMGPDAGEQFWQGCRKLVNVRNPYDLTLSAHSWETQDLSQPIDVSTWYFDGPTRTPRLKTGRDYLRENLNYYLDDDGDFVPDRFIRYENLAEDLRTFATEVGLRPGELPAMKGAVRQRGTTELAEAVAEDVEDLYRPLIRRFGYRRPKRRGR